MRTSTHPRVLVRAGGFIGHHLVTALKQRSYWVRGVDTSLPEYTVRDADEFELRDLRRFDECLLATRGIDHVDALAADMGGMSFISANHATILRNNALINIHTLESARVNGASRYLFSSSGHVEGPQGVRGRNSDSRRLREVLGWAPSVTLRQGLEPTYRWIEKQVTSRTTPWAATGR